MRIVIIYNKDLDKVISKLGIQNREFYRDTTIEKIEASFVDRGYDVRVIDGNLEMFENLRDIIKEKDRIPFVFNLAYGIQGECRYTHIPSILEMLGLPYFGSGPFGHTLALDKIISKILMDVHHIPTPVFWKFDNKNDLKQDIEFPVIVKPEMEADSYGLKVVHDREELTESVTSLLDEFSQTIFAEKFIKGREFALAMAGNGNEIECMPLIEVDLDEKTEGIFTSDQKIYNPKFKPAGDSLPRETVREMEEKAKIFFSFLRLKDYARADIRMDSDGRYYFLEFNSMANLAPTGSFMTAARAAGYKYDEMINKLLETGMRKYFLKNEKLKLRYESKNNSDRK